MVINAVLYGTCGRFTARIVYVLLVYGDEFSEARQRKSVKNTAQGSVVSERI